LLSVAAFPLFGAALVEVLAAVPSSEFDCATPEYSKMARYIAADVETDTVTVFAPPAMFSA
jgi:hypothetical protein